MSRVCIPCLWRNRKGKRKQCREGEKQRRPPELGSSTGLVLSSEQEKQTPALFWDLEEAGTSYTVHGMELQWVHLDSKGKMATESGGWRLPNSHTQTKRGLDYRRRGQFLPELNSKFLLKSVTYSHISDLLFLSLPPPFLPCHDMDFPYYDVW